jgi:hypothetical protein
MSATDAIKAVSALRVELAASAFKWTGIEERLASDPTITEEIFGSLQKINVLIEQTGLTNAERAKAHAINNALVSLVNSPEPEWQAVINLLSSQALNNIIGVANIVLFVFQLFGSQ